MLRDVPGKGEIRRVVDEDGLGCVRDYDQE